MNWRLILAIIWTLIILGLCSIPGRDIPKVDVVQIDKFVHAFIFFVFGILWLRVQNSRPRYFVVLTGGLIYAVFTEVYQGWLPWDRTPDPLDALANSVGIVLAIGIYWAMKRKRK